MCEWRVCCYPRSMPSSLLISVRGDVWCREGLHCALLQHILECDKVGGLAASGGWPVQLLKGETCTVTSQNIIQVVTTALTLHIHQQKRVNLAQTHHHNTKQ